MSLVSHQFLTINYLQASFKFSKNLSSCFRHNKNESLGYNIFTASEPDRCSLCADLSRHALCIVNLNTGEKIGLDIYEPHPFIVGEIAEDQSGGYFCFIRGAGVEGYKIAAESIVLSIPANSDRINQRLFCNSCRRLLCKEATSGYILADLKLPEEPVIYSTNTTTSFIVRCYSVSIQTNIEDNEYTITVTGHYGESDFPTSQ